MVWFSLFARPHDEIERKLKLNVNSTGGKKRILMGKNVLAQKRMRENKMTKTKENWEK